MTRVPITSDAHYKIVLFTVAQNDFHVTIQYTPCPVMYTLCPVVYALCPVVYALCPVVYAPCPALCPGTCIIMI